MEKINIENVFGVGPKTNQTLNKLNIYSTNDLVEFFPRKYEFFNLKKANHKANNQTITIKAIINSKLELIKSNKTEYIKFQVLNNEKIINVIAFNQNYLLHVLKQNDKVYLKGKYTYYNNQLILNKLIMPNNFMPIKPIYNIENISDTNITNIISHIFNNKLVNINEILPENIITKYNLLNRYDAFYNIHLAQNINNLNAAIKRFKYEEAYLFQKQLLNNVDKKVYRKPKNYNLKLVKKLIDTINFELTNDQKKAVNDIFSDFKQNYISYRLIQGDVGSGKTIVAAIGIYGAITAKEQVALMAPTELLAKQHYNDFKKLFKGFANVELLTSDIKNKNEILSNLKTGKIDLIIGTHALIQDNVEFHNLGLIVIDEQHKFGVNTRKNLINKSLNADLIYLTATPIPRTLAISLFNEAKISTIKSKPQYQKPVYTKVILDKDINIIIEELKKCLNLNQKAYVVVPAIESTHAKYNIENVYELLSKHIDNKYIYAMHGKLKKEEQQIVMEQFSLSSKAILLATTMIEVGINVKSATLMVIFSADYFGLSQLHQLRGRVGRYNLESKCFLITQDEIPERLKIIEKENDGFNLSKYDLKLRGPGNLLGFEQTGMPSFKFLDFVDDYEILYTMRKEIISNNKI